MCKEYTLHQLANFHCVPETQKLIFAGFYHWCIISSRCFHHSLISGGEWGSSCMRWWSEDSLSTTGKLIIVIAIVIVSPHGFLQGPRHPVRADLDGGRAVPEDDQQRGEGLPLEAADQDPRWQAGWWSWGCRVRKINIFSFTFDLYLFIFTSTAISTRSTLTAI